MTYIFHMNDFEIKQLWVDKYKPKTIDDLVLDSNIKKFFKDQIASNNIVNTCFYGPPGIGKSTICQVICNEMNAVKLFIPCAVEGNVATAQGKLREFCDAMPFENRLKIVILDEVDAASATQDSSFQKALRNLIEEAQGDCRFLLNCNYVEKVIQPIKSRCPVVNLRFDKKDLLLRLKLILDSEKISYNRDSLKAFIESAFKLYPDIRRIVNYLQSSCASGTLVVNETTINDTEKEGFLKELVDKSIQANNMLDVRKFYLANKDKISDYVMFASDVFNYVVDNSIILNSDGILKLTDMLYYMNMVIDKESMFFGMLVAINKWHE